MLKYRNAPDVVIFEEHAAPLLEWLETNQTQPRMKIMAVSEKDAKEAWIAIHEMMSANTDTSRILFNIAAYLDQFYKQHQA